MLEAPAVKLGWKRVPSKLGGNVFLGGVKKLTLPHDASVTLAKLKKISEHGIQLEIDFPEMDMEGRLYMNWFTKLLIDSAHHFNLPWQAPHKRNN